MKGCGEQEAYPYKDPKMQLISLPVIKCVVDQSGKRLKNVHILLQPYYKRDSIVFSPQSTHPIIITFQVRPKSRLC